MNKIASTPTATNTNIRFVFCIKTILTNEARIFRYMLIEYNNLAAQLKGITRLACKIKATCRRPLAFHLVLLKLLAFTKTQIFGIMATHESLRISESGGGDTLREE
jgi:hypothetical protein